MYKFTVFIVAFFSLFFQSVIAAPIQQGFRGNVTLYIKSDSEEVNGKTMKFTLVITLLQVPLSTYNQT